MMDPIERGEQDRESYAVGPDECPDCGYVDCHCNGHYEDEPEVEEEEHGQPFKPLDVDQFQEALRKYYEGLQRQPDPNEPDGETLAQSQAFVLKLFGGPNFCNGGR